MDVFSMLVMYTSCVICYILCICSIYRNIYVGLILRTPFFGFFKAGNIPYNFQRFHSRDMDKKKPARVPVCKSKSIKLKESMSDCYKHTCSLHKLNKVRSHTLIHKKKLPLKFSSFPSRQLLYVVCSLSVLFQ